MLGLLLTAVLLGDNLYWYYPQSKSNWCIINLTNSEWECPKRQIELWNRHKHTSKKTCLNFWFCRWAMLLCQLARCYLIKKWQVWLLFKNPPPFSVLVIIFGTDFEELGYRNFATMFSNPWSDEHSQEKLRFRSHEPLLCWIISPKWMNILYCVENTAFYCVRIIRSIDYLLDVLSNRQLKISKLRKEHSATSIDTRRSITIGKIL